VVVSYAANHHNFFRKKPKEEIKPNVKEESVLLKKYQPQQRSQSVAVKEPIMRNEASK
jgi:hypothetical protein